MAGNRLFRPDENLDVRNPTSDTQENGNIVNPPRFAQFGGLVKGARGLFRNNKGIQTPANTLRKVPQKNNTKAD